MANRRLSMRKIEEVLRLYHEGGRSHREIALSVRTSPTTVGEYLRRAKLAGLAWPLPADMTELALEAALFPMPASKVKRPEPDWAAIHREMGKKGEFTKCLCQTMAWSLLPDY